MSDEPEMPDDWDDHAGWEAYYRSLPSDEFRYNAATRSVGRFDFDQLGSLIADFQNREWLTLWFPGCGFSPLPRLLAAFGFSVYATDIAPSAIEYQKTNSKIVEPLVGRVEDKHARTGDGGVIAEVHDFRTSFGVDRVDAIFNIKAIQALSTPSIAAACRSHFEALRPGRVAFFDTMNLQGEGRQRLEDALADAGFYVPLRELTRWYRAALAETGIPHMMVLGDRPVIPRRDDYPYPHERGSPEWERDVGILRGIAAQYRSRMESAFAEEQASVTEQTKHVQLIYATG